MIAPFYILGKQFSMYMIMGILGIAAAVIYLYFSTKRPGYDRAHLLEIFVFVLIGSIVGGHLLFFMTRIGELVRMIKGGYRFFESWDSLKLAAASLFGGTVFYGGLLGGIAGCYLYCRHEKIDFNVHINALTPAVPLFHTFGRIGCLLGGCCYGFESETGFHFPYSPTADPEKTYFPIQIVESAFNLILFTVLLVLFIKKKPKNVNLLMIYLPVYAVGRFILEFFRGDTVRGLLFGLSTSQWVSLAILAFVAVYALIKIKKSKPETIQSKDFAA